MNKFISSLFIIPLISIAVFIFLPLDRDFEPVAYKTQLPSYTGVLAKNNQLDNMEILFQNRIYGAESIAEYKGALYAGNIFGEIVRIENDKITTICKLDKHCTKESISQPGCSRPLGIRITKSGTIYVADALLGIVQVDIKTGNSKVLFRQGTVVEGRPVLFPDDLDIDEVEGKIYFSDVSSKRNYHQFLVSLLEHDGTGRVLSLDIKTGKIEVLLRNGYFPNGVQFAPDKTALLVVHLGAEQILKIHLRGSRRGQVEVFSDNLPGIVDNIRPSSRGGYWVALGAISDTSRKEIETIIATYPIIRKIAYQASYAASRVLRYMEPLLATKALADYFANAQWYMAYFSWHGAVIELDATGKIIRFFNSNNQPYYGFSEILEKDGYLYLGSFINPYIGRFSLLGADNSVKTNE